MDLCGCKLQNPIDKKFEAHGVAHFVFPCPGLCRKFWPTKTLFTFDATKWPALANTQAKVYTTPGSPVPWVDWTYKGIKEAYKPLTYDMVNSIPETTDWMDVGEIQFSWCKDPMWVDVD